MLTVTSSRNTAFWYCCHTVSSTKCSDATRDPPINLPSSAVQRITRLSCLYDVGGSPVSVLSYLTFGGEQAAGRFASRRADRQSVFVCFGRLSIQPQPFVSLARKHATLPESLASARLGKPAHCYHTCRHSSTCSCQNAPHDKDRDLHKV